MELIERFSETAKRYLITRQERKTDVLLGILRSISAFEDLLDGPRTDGIVLPDSDSLPSSHEYNDAIIRVMDDLNAIREHQLQTMNSLLSSWNSTEQIIATEEEHPKIDLTFPTIVSQGKANGHITLGVRRTNSGIPELSRPPVLNATSTDPSVPVTYGKAYGVFVIGNETGDDGIRPNDNDGSKVIDQRDTFWESEAVTLQESQSGDVFTPQETNTNELSLSVNISLSFRNLINVNFLTIDPHSFSQSVYYQVVSINLISGAKTIPVLATPIIVNQKTRITFPTTTVNAMQISLRQDKGYFEKFTLARYSIGNNVAWIDLTGPELISRVDRNIGDVNKAIRDEIENASDWIASIWVPDSPSNEQAVLDVTAGDGGYHIVESSESKRKRWGIGIQEIEFGEEIYEDTSEVVTSPYTMPDETTSIYLIADEETPTGTEISYALSFDDGATWNDLSPINRPPELLDSGYLVPQKIAINSDLSAQRKENSLTGTAGYVNTASRKVRVRAILKKSEGGVNTPRIRDFYPVFDTSVPTI